MIFWCMPSITPTERILARYCLSSLMSFISIILKPGHRQYVFLGYAVSQIPAGFSSPNAVPGAGIALHFRLLRLYADGHGELRVWPEAGAAGTGLSEGPCPVGLASTINNWFPPKESHGNRRLHRGDHVCADCAAAGGVDCGDRGGGGSFSLLYPELWRPSRGICWSNPSLLRADLFPKANWQRLMPGVKVIIIAYAKIS